MSDRTMSAGFAPRANPPQPEGSRAEAVANPLPGTFLPPDPASLPEAGDARSAGNGPGAGISRAGAASDRPPRASAGVQVAGLSSRKMQSGAADPVSGATATGPQSSSTADEPEPPAPRAASMPTAHRALRLAPWLVMTALTVLLLATAALALSLGASGLSPWHALTRTLSPAESAILYNIRLPRLVMGAYVGAGLAVSGAIMQGLFRNPLADPGLVGVSAGGGLGAITGIVLGSALPLGLQARLGSYLVPAMSFAGAWVTMMILYRIARSRGRVSMATLLLAGIVLGALAGAASGILVYLADDRQLRDLTFWGLGSLAGSSWLKVATAGPLLTASILLSPLLARGLNALALGEAAARHMGINVERSKTAAILLVSAAAGAAVAVSGGIGFVGIVVPHLLRLVLGPDHRTILPASALLGAALLIGADTVSRLLVAPAELPIGIVMSLIGAPVFLWVLLSRRQVVEA